MYGIWINQVRHALGPPPRRFSPEVNRQLTPPIPAWTRHTPNEPLLQQYQSHAMLFSQGAVNWAALLQANNKLFEAGENNGLPALLVFSPDEYFDEVPSQLRKLAHELYDLRDDPGDDPELRAFAEQMNDEYERFGRREVPSRITGGKQVFMVDVMVHREHLPGGAVTGYVFPVLHHPDTWNVWIVPQLFWPEEFTTAWGELA